MAQISQRKEGQSLRGTIKCTGAVFRTVQITTRPILIFKPLAKRPATVESRVNLRYADPSGQWWVPEPQSNTKGNIPRRSTPFGTDADLR